MISKIFLMHLHCDEKISDDHLNYLTLDCEDELNSISMQSGVPKKAIQYIFFEIWPSLIIGLVVFLFILMMAQAIRYTEFVLIHGVGLETVLLLFSYLCISFLPALLPMSLLFAVIMTYGRLSQDSEIIALKSSGLSMISITFPSLILGTFVALISAQTSFHIAPWGNRQFELLITELGQTKASASLREGTFSEGFFDLVVYAQKVDTKAGGLSRVFIFDERDPQTPLTIIAKKGQLVQDPLIPGHSAQLRLQDGDIHRKGQNHTKIKFNSFDLKLFDPIKLENREKSLASLNIEEIAQKMKLPETPPDQKLTLQVEFHKRWAISVVCLIFCLLGVGLGVRTNQRNQKSAGLVLCLASVILYWVVYIGLEGVARSGKLPVIPAIWAPNFLFSLITGFVLKKNWN